MHKWQGKHCSFVANDPLRDEVLEIYGRKGVVSLRIPAVKSASIIEITAHHVDLSEPY